MHIIMNLIFNFDISAFVRRKCVKDEKNTWISTILKKLTLTAHSLVFNILFETTLFVFLFLFHLHGCRLEIVYLNFSFYIWVTVNGTGIP